MGFTEPEKINDMRQVALSQSELKTEEANEQTVVPATNRRFQLDDLRVINTELGDG